MSAAVNFTKKAACKIQIKQFESDVTTLAQVVQMIV